MTLSWSWRRNSSPLSHLPLKPGGKEPKNPFAFQTQPKAFKDLISLKMFVFVAYLIISHFKSGTGSLMSGSRYLIKMKASRHFCRGVKWPVCWRWAAFQISRARNYRPMTLPLRCHMGKDCVSPIHALSDKYSFLSIPIACTSVSSAILKSKIQGKTEKKRVWRTARWLS